MRKINYIALVLISAVLLSGCVISSDPPIKEQDETIPVTEVTAVPSPIATASGEQTKNTVSVTVDSLPSGATVFVQDDKNQGKMLDTVGSTPLKVELAKGKKYMILTVFSIEQYRERTRDIPEIQERLDKFKQDEKAGLIKPGHWYYFFETYTQDLQEFRFENPNRLEFIGIPIYLDIPDSSRDKMRVASVFVPEGMNPDILLPLVDKSKKYTVTKDAIIPVMKRNNAPEDLIDRTYNLLEKTGVTIAVYPGAMLSDGTQEKIAIHFTTSDADDSKKTMSVVVYQTIFGATYDI